MNMQEISDCLSQEAQHVAEARLAAKRAARAEAREIRMKELERQQKEIYQVQKKYYGLDAKWGDIEQWMEDSERYSHRSRRTLQASDEDDLMSVGSRSSLRVEERSDKEFSDKGSRPVSSLSAATLASLGGTSSRRGSGDTSISVDTEASIREIKEISELRDQIEDVEGKYMQGLKEMKDSLAEVEEKYKRSMVTNAQLDNEKSSLQYQVDTLRDVLLELEEELAESRRQYEDKHKECERQKHDQNVLRFQLAELKDALEQREQLLSEIRQLQQKQENNHLEICDLKETIEWKDKKIGALERQKEFFDPVRNERDDLREEVNRLREMLKKHGIALDLEETPNGDASLDPHIIEDCYMESPPKESALDFRLKKLQDERESFLDQIKRLKNQLEERNQRNMSPENLESEDMENGSDLQRDANRQISDLKFKLTKSTQEITALEQNIIRLESQLTRYKASSENAEKVEDELKAEKRRLQRELRTALDKIEELEVSNSHLIKRLEKMKANRSAILSQQ
ncbi:hypothetical protein GDO86_017003 [Hymenochirus boettgeri]|uniref:Leucine-rich repeat flightless-interacting protein 2 n=1 Tax=Hymenochirus boettgeri TaxID=247094 RepID=A0A8T2INX8_9PIPI|nr:hypothetical protein GDO86_017003 [Hymenochirus boettgeri]